MRILRLLSFVATLHASLASAQQASPPAPASPAPVPPSAAPMAPPAQPPPNAAPYAAPPPAQTYPYPQPSYYPPVVDLAERRAVLGELANVDAQIANVQVARSRHGLGGPIAMMAAGYGTALVFSIVALVQFGLAEDIEHKTYFGNEYDYHDYDLNDDGDVNGEDEDRARRGARTVGALGIAALGVGVGGTVFLARRLAARRKFNPELDSLRMRRLQLLRHLQYGGALGANGMQLRLSGRF